MAISNKPTNSGAPEPQVSALVVNGYLTSNGATTARLMAEALGPRDVDGGATPSAATRGRLSLVALLTPSSDGAPALRSRWRLSGAATLDSYSFAAAPHEDAASGPELVLR